MEKFLKYGEQYIQWIALGIGGLYLLMMAYLYLAAPPVTAKVNNQDRTPGDIDAAIKNGIASQVKEEMDSSKVWVNFAASDPVALLNDSLARAPIDLKPVPAPPWLVKGSPTTGPTEAPTLASIPKAVSATQLASLGTSLVSIPAQPPPVVTANGAAPAPAPVAVSDTQRDCDWVTEAFTIKRDDLNAAFQAAHVPEFALNNYAFLKVEAVRERQLLNGQWGDEHPLDSIPTVGLLPMPPEADNSPAGIQAKTDFNTWAAANAANILTPPFFPVIFGTHWYAPGDPKPDDVFAPANAPVQNAPAQIAPNPGPAGNPHGGATGRLPPPLARPGLPPPPYLSPERRSMGGPGETGIAGGSPFSPPAPVFPGAGVNIQNQPGGDATVYVHDWTVVAGQTYRYKIRYWVSNPLFQAKGAVKQDVQNVLALKSADSDWSAPIAIASRYEFWVQKFTRNPINPEVVFDLFAKKPAAPGGVERSTIRANPGDAIGPSGSFLVDVRADARNHNNTWYFLVAGPDGKVQRRDVDHDSKDQRHLDLLDVTGAAARVP